ncbi:acyl-coa n-acyltransferase [Lucifera butyrica]|uniref:Acyl-coa n-acyltransferase n=1 Tax=Lucifera butyrica TaxID=1351585 RepID=A0A498RAA3_9FIRM|nr:GNAT family N-acetyltransferase [Lucifera butyrica]VBB07053.1 acyl-coa n-acyltransferase [Lucifera butyrica]
MIELVRTIEPRLIQRLVQLETEAFGAGGMNEWHLVPLIRHGRVYVIRENHEVVGAVQYMLDWDFPQRAYMVGVSISREVRGRGLGTKLLRESILALAQDHIEQVELTVDPDNAAAIAVYEKKLGFQAVELRLDEYGSGENRLVMHLPVAAFPVRPEKK